MQLLRGLIACGLQRFAEAEDAVRRIEQSTLEARRPLDLARARLIQAQILATTRPESPAPMLAALQEANMLGQEGGTDAALVADAMPLGQLLRHAAAAGWPYASDWLRRQQELRWIGQMLVRAPGRPVLVVHALGSDEIVLDEKPVDIGWLKAREVLHYLLAHPRGASAEVLREAIWPDLGSDGSRNALKTAVHQLRARLPRDMITTQGRTLYRLNREVADISYDLEQFMALLDVEPTNPDILERALDLYKGPYLAWSDSTWSDEIRAHVAQRFLYGLRTAAELYEQDGLYLDALNMYHRLLAVDDLDEAAHTGVMRCQVRLGNRAAAISQYQALRRILDHQLGLDPGRSSEAERIYLDLLTAS
jgi:DNA-binding SARP family transcriptional activator